MPVTDGETKAPEVEQGPTARAGSLSGFPESFRPVHWSPPWQVSWGRSHLPFSLGPRGYDDLIFPNNKAASGVLKETHIPNVPFA